MTTPQPLVWDCATCGLKANPDPGHCRACGSVQPPDVLLYPPDGAPEEEILMGVWDCTSCDRKGIEGDKYECADCGSHRPEDVTFYLPEDARQITDAAEIAAAKAGADWQCEYCDQWVKAGISGCPYCAGGEIETAKRQETTEEVQLDEGPRTPPAAVAAVAAEDESSKAGNPASFGCCCLAIVVFLLLAAFFGRSTQVGVVVSGHSWERTQKVEVYKTVAKEGWSKPGDAFDVTSERKVHHHDTVLVRTETRYRTETEKIKVGEERYKAGTKKKNLGNGRFKKVPVYKKRPIYKTRDKKVAYQHKVTKQVPRYQLWYRFRVKRWVEEAPRHTSGKGLEPEWPPTDVSGKDQRMGARSGTYTVHLTSSEEGAESYRYDVDESAWRGYTEGSTWTAIVSGGKVTELRQPK